MELAAGAFVGNWLVIPSIFRGTTYLKGFGIGIIAAIIILISAPLIHL
jgi:hypothetical protein